MAAALIEIVIRLLILGVVVGVLIWIIDTAPFVPEPLRAIIRWVLIVAAVLIALLWLLPLAGVRI
jgi:hypothetical protein